MVPQIAHQTINFLRPSVQGRANFEPWLASEQARLDYEGESEDVPEASGSQVRLRCDKASAKNQRESNPQKEIDGLL